MKTTLTTLALLLSTACAGFSPTSPTSSTSGPATTSSVIVWMQNNCDALITYNRDIKAYAVLEYREGVRPLSGDTLKGDIPTMGFITLFNATRGGNLRVRVVAAHLAHTNAQALALKECE